MITLELFEYLERMGLSDLSGIGDVFNYTGLRRKEIANEVFARIRPPRSPMDSLFSFVANSTLAGAPYPCEATKCRMDNIEKLAQFSALYADKVLIPSPFDRFNHDAEIDPNDLAVALATLVELRPLVEEGIVEFAVTDMHFCSDCLQGILRSETEFHDVFEPLIEVLGSDYMRNTSFFLESGEGKPFVRIEGPEKYVSHGKMFVHFRETPGYVQELLGTRESVQLPDDIVLNRGFLGRMLEPLIRDHTLGDFWMKLAGGTYLTERELDADLLDLMHGESTRRISTGMVNGLSHMLPMVTGVPLVDILKFRETERESFAVYRDSVTKVVKNLRTQDPEVYREAYSDIIRPELNKVELSVSNASRKLWKSVGIDAATWGILGAFGLYSGLADPTIASIIALFGGAGFAKDIIKNFVMAHDRSSVARESPYYFLWRMEQV